MYYIWVKTSIFGEKKKESQIWKEKEGMGAQKDKIS